MQVFDNIREIRAYLSALRCNGKTLGFVPTMGALHAGHLQLVAAADKENDCTICSIFVNPTQFNNQEDLIHYPRTLEDDLEKLKDAGCAVVFVPKLEEMYPKAPSININFGDLELEMEGEHRPGHFNGVGIVVAKLFNIIMPDKAYFGQKDLQQVAIIKRLIDDFSIPVNLVCHPIVREHDGLAMSSRNIRLSRAARKDAPLIFKALLHVKDFLLAGGDVTKSKEVALDILSDSTLLSVEYLTVTHADTLKSIGTVNVGDTVAICIAVRADGVRLIDNLLFNL